MVSDGKGKQDVGVCVYGRVSGKTNEQHRLENGTPRETEKPGGEGKKRTREGERKRERERERVKRTRGVEGDKEGKLVLRQEAGRKG